MTAEDRKFLTEAMGKDWSEPYLEDYADYGKGRTNLRIVDRNRAFTTWTDFGWLWEWAQKQEWWPDFWRYLLRIYLERNKYVIGFSLEGIDWTIDPLRFPQLIVNFLRERKKGDQDDPKA